MRAGRRFGLEIGSLCLAAAAMFLVREQHGATVFVVAAAAFLSLAILRPQWLEPVARHWLALGVVLARVTTPVALLLLWALIVVPLGLVRRLVGRSPLRRDARAVTFWRARAPLTPAERREAMRHMY
ncbi:MAG: hypothetical protein H0W68_11745 [Gemmatimonadaceae bacterium]|nr:hypothetical protein [Gemmatimonadaceae bacterium]